MRRPPRLRPTVELGLVLACTRPPEGASTVAGRRSGYLQDVDVDPLPSAAAQHDVTIGFVILPLSRIMCALTDVVARHVDLGEEAARSKITQRADLDAVVVGAQEIRLHPAAPRPTA